MAKLTLAEINAEVDAAYASALASPVAVAAHSISDNAVLKTDLYAGGFVVRASVNLGWRRFIIAKQHGPETQLERPAPPLANLVAECQTLREKAYSDSANACSVYDLADAETKLASTDATVEAAGAVQKSAALAKRLAIKAQFPKPE